MVPSSRIRALNPATVDFKSDYVLYWMVANRRSEWNFSLQRALEWSAELGRPLVVFEPLGCKYRWASDRIHQFVVEGMRDNREAFAGTPVRYYPYLEPSQGEGRGLLEALADRACVVVTDDFPSFFLPRMLEAAASRLKVKLESVDSNGLYPMRLAEKTFLRAVDFRRYLQKSLEPHLEAFPQPKPLDSVGFEVEAGLSPEVLRRWPEADLDGFRSADFPLDHSVAPVGREGGSKRARQLLLRFLSTGLRTYADDRNHPQRSATSGLSPYLHFGHVSVHQVFAGVARLEGWHLGKLGLQARGKRQGWWGMSEVSEAFLDQIVTWRELGYNMCWREPNYDRWSSLPAWAIATLEEHAEDAREYVYGLERFEFAQTHDPLWNAAQNQLRREGVIHNYLRMLWAKKILHWTSHPREALEICLHLNNKYSIDGRDPNSYSGVFWTFGRYDRPWGPERPIFGKVRYMTSASTQRKFKTAEYIAEYSSQ